MDWFAAAGEGSFPSEGVIAPACGPFVLDFLFLEVAEFEARKFTYIVELLRHQRVLEQESAKAKLGHFVSDIAAAWLSGFRETRLSQMIESNIDLFLQMVCSVALWLELGLFFQEEAM